MKMWVFSVLLCLFAMRVAMASETTKPYPPPGSPDPGPVCLRKDAPPWVGFLCRFMTVDLWKAAGRPTFIAHDGSHWQPWYYGDQADRGNNLLYEGFAYRPGRDGLLEAMLKTDTLPDEYDPAYVRHFWSLFRYTPWSIHFAHEAGCGDGSLANPHALAAREEGDKFPRSSLLGMGWRQLAEDGKDPTQGFGAAAMPVFMGLAEVVPMLDAGQHAGNDKGHGLRNEINAVAGGRGDLHPDYSRDGEVWLVRADGTAKRVDDLDAAALDVVNSGVLLTNGAGQSWRRGFDLAKIPARDRKRPVVYLYFAQDAFYPVGDNHVYRRRLQYLVDRAAHLIKGGKPGFTLVSMGRSAPLAVHAARRYSRITQLIIEPIVASVGGKELRSAVREGSQQINIVAGDAGPPASIAPGLTADTKAGLCLGGRTTGAEIAEALRRLDTSEHGSQATGR